MTDQTHQRIADEFPPADTLSLLPAAMLTRAYNEIRARAIRLEAASLRVARLNPNAGEIGAGMLATIVEEAQAALNP
jgi:hypothetical protein